MSKIKRMKLYSKKRQTKKSRNLGQTYCKQIESRCRRFNQRFRKKRRKSAQNLIKSFDLEIDVFFRFKVNPQIYACHEQRHAIFKLLLSRQSRDD